MIYCRLPCINGVLNVQQDFWRGNFLFPFFFSKLCGMETKRDNKYICVREIVSKKKDFALNWGREKQISGFVQRIEKGRTKEINNAEKISEKDSQEGPAKLDNKSGERINEDRNWNDNDVYKYIYVYSQIQWKGGFFYLIAVITFNGDKEDIYFSVIITSWRVKGVGTINQRIDFYFIRSLILTLSVSLLLFWRTMSDG